MFDYGQISGSLPVIAAGYRDYQPQAHPTSSHAGCRSPGYCRYRFSSVPPTSRPSLNYTVDITGRLRSCSCGGWRHVYLMKSTFESREQGKFHVSNGGFVWGIQALVRYLLDI